MAYLARRPKRSRAAESAVILAFPQAKRTAFIRKQALWFLDQVAHAAEANLQHQVRLQRNTMLRRGVDPASVDRECAELMSAIRGEVWRLVLTPDGR